jgi:hypothetical protein
MKDDKKSKVARRCKGCREREERGGCKERRYEEKEGRKDAKGGDRRRRKEGCKVRR